jgi:hypothetical protein
MLTVCSLSKTPHNLSVTTWIQLMFEELIQSDKLGFNNYLLKNDVSCYNSRLRDDNHDKQY